MEFNFSIEKNLRESWILLKKYIGFFVALALVSFILNIASGENTPLPVLIILMVATFIWSLVMMKVSLFAADNKVELLSFSKIKEILPNWNQAIGYLGVMFLGGLLIFSGLILLIIPGIWVMVRLSLAGLSFLDKGEGVKKALWNSWHMTKGKVFWTAVLVSLTSVLLYIVGLLLVGVGILITYPLAMIFMAKFYRALTVHYGHATEMVVQPVEILAPQPEIEEVETKEEVKVEGENIAQ